LEADSQLPAVKGTIMLAMNPIFGFFFVIAGLSFAVFLGIVLYKDKSKEQVVRSKDMKLSEEN
jgi:hypothetical protein